MHAPFYYNIVQSIDDIPPPLPPKMVTLDEGIKSAPPSSAQMQPECGSEDVSYSISPESKL